MEILEQPSRQWSAVIRCKRCRAKLQVNQDDLQLEGFKTSGYHFTGTAVIEDLFIIVCPVDNVDNQVDEETIPVILQDELREALRQRRADRGY